MSRVHLLKRQVQHATVKRDIRFHRPSVDSNQIFQTDQKPVLYKF
uniref:Uncharacterized protein n=1 Tax=Anguilla anguilla TaxID=7936 RepID=A0A0E9U521_ANGAN